MEFLKFFILIIMFLMIFIIKKKFLKVYFIFIAFTLSIISFYFNPPSNFDLSRHFEMLENCRMYGFDYIINHNDYKALPVAAIYMYFISILGYNGFLPAITCFISYMCVFIVLYKFCKNEKYTRASIVLAFMTFVVTYNYIGLISGIRNKLCFSIFFYLLYMDIVKNKNKVLITIGYIALAFIHPSIIVLIILRMLLFIKNKKITISLEIILLMWSYLKNFIIIILSNFTNIGIINLIFNKMNTYDAEEAMMVANVPLYTFIYFTRNVILLLIFIKYNKLSKNKLELKKYNRFVIYTFCFCFGSIFEYHFFVRMSEFLMLLNLIPIIYLFSNAESVKISRFNVPNIILKILLLIIIVEFAIFLFYGQYQVLF